MRRGSHRLLRPSPGALAVAAGAALAGALAAAGGGAAAPSGLTVDHLAADVAMQPWYALSAYPNAVKSGGKTWVAYQNYDYATSLLQNVVRLYDHTSQSWGAVNRIGDTSLNTDNHSIPTLVRDDAGYWHSFGGAHNGPEMYWSTSAPDDPSTFTFRATLEDQYAYPHPVMVGGKLYLFIRRFDQPNNRYKGYIVTSATNAAGVMTFNAGISLIDLGDDSRFYMGNFVVVGTDIHFVVTRANAADDYRKDVFYCIYDTTNGTLFNFDKSVGVTSGNRPATQTQMQTSFRIVDQTDALREGQVPCLAILASGERAIAYYDGLSAGGTRDVNVISITGGVLGASVTLATVDNSNSSIALHANADGTLECWYTKTAAGGFTTGGDVYRRVRAVGGAWGAEQLVRAAGKLYGYTAITPVQFGGDDLAMAFGENTGTSTSGVNLGRVLRAYAYSSGATAAPVKAAWTPHANSAAFFARMTAQETDQVKIAVDQYIRMISDSLGIWGNLELLNINALATEQAALLDATARHTLLKEGGMAFVAGVGFDPDGVDDALDLGFNPATTGSLLISQNSVGMFAFVLDEGQNAAPSLATISAAAPGLSLVPRSATDTLTGRANDGTTSSVANTSAVGFFATQRKDAATKGLYHGTVETTAAVASTGVANGQMHAFRSLAAWTDKRMPVFGIATLLPRDKLFALENLTRRLVLDDLALAPPLLDHLSVGVTSALSMSRPLLSTFAGAKFTASGGAISALKDQTPAGHDFAATGANQPLATTVNGKPWADFDGVDDRLIGPLISTLFTGGAGFMAVSFNADTITTALNVDYFGNQLIGDSALGGDIVLGLSGTDTLIEATQYDGAYRQTPRLAIAPGQPAVAAMWWDGTNLHLRLNNSAPVSTPMAAITAVAFTLNIGGTNTDFPFDGKVLEFISCNGVPTAAEIDAIISSMMTEAGA